MAHFKARQHFKSYLSYLLSNQTSPNNCVFGVMLYFLVFCINLVLSDEAQTSKSIRFTFKNPLNPILRDFFKKSENSSTLGLRYTVKKTLRNFLIYTIPKPKLIALTKVRGVLKSSFQWLFNGVKHKLPTCLFDCVLKA